MKANLHVNKKHTSVLVVILIGILTLLTIVVSVSTIGDISHLNALLLSDYEYSAVAQSTTAPDRYIQFNAGIWFALSSDADTRLSVDVVMQAEAAEYTDAVSWNADELSARGVAVSQNITDTYNLSVGDSIYSKHIVDGTVYEYTIETIIPSVIGVRITDDSSYNTGLIIMGFDQRYVDNITNNSLVFTKEPIDVLDETCIGAPEQLVYRKDEMSIIGIRILPYVLAYVVLAVCSMIGMVHFLSRTVECNFRRLAMIGCGQQELNATYNRLLWSTSGIVITLGFVIALAAFCTNELCWISLAIPAVAAIAETLAVQIGSTIVKHRLWRK